MKNRKDERHSFGSSFYHNDCLVCLVCWLLYLPLLAVCNQSTFCRRFVRL